MSALIFAAGVVCGSAGTVLGVQHKLRYAVHHPDQASAAVARAIGRRLRLDQDQRNNVHAIVRRTQARIQQLRRGVQPRIEAALEEAATEIDSVLREDQQARWRRWVHRLRQWRPPPPPESAGS